MATLSITVANIRLATTSLTEPATCGENITPMQPIYKSTDGKYYKAANTSDTLANATALAFSYGTANGPILIVTGGGIVPGATLVAGEKYIVAASGLISDVGDHGTGEYGTDIGWASSTTQLELAFKASGVARG